MTITPESLVKHEITGLHAHIVDARDPGLVCREGTIIGETRNMVYLETLSGLVKVPKSVSVFDMQLPNDTVVRVDGHLLAGRPEDRLKRPIKRRW
ncbi:MAG: ribonuclease P protein component 1 [Candidatus Thorarchaeota archaeon]|nr:ribonuclease P protein component 1 [Candidatus Thorarchaeota archaeon]